MKRSSSTVQHQIIKDRSVLKVMTIFGTRPEAIKLASIIKELEKHKNIESIVTITAQHREMLDQVLNIFDINPDYDLNLMKNNQSLTDITTRAIQGIGELLVETKPDLILIQGDTTTTFASALAAFYQKIQIGHIEAGLRTNDKYEPFPEEINRRLTSHVVDFHFAPTERAKNNLLRETIDEGKIFVTGNTVIDSLLYTIQKIRKSDFRAEGLMAIDFEKEKVILVTGHRRESFGQGLRNICYALKEIAGNNSNTKIVYPVHLNPNVRKPVNEIIGNVNNILLFQPLDYKSFVYLMSKSYLILTDSGGIQEEAPTFGIPVLVMREVTERLEAVEAGLCKLIGTNNNSIVKETQRLLNDKKEYNNMIAKQNPYGDGKASKRIVEIVSGNSG